jgi:hypothetical protein
MATGDDTKKSRWDVMRHPLMIFVYAVCGVVALLITGIGTLNLWIKQQVGSEIDARISRGELITSGSKIVLENTADRQKLLTEGPNLIVIADGANTDHNLKQVWFVEHFELQANH